MNKQLLVLTISSVAAVMLLLGTAQEAEAAGYLKIDGIDGESTAEGHENWINLLSVSQSIDRNTQAGASGSTRHRASATFGDIVVVKEVDASTPKLQEAIAEGTNFPTVMIDFTKTFGDETIEKSKRSNEVVYLQWELKNARISSYSFSGAASGDPIPTDQISLNFEEIKVTYHKLDPKTGESNGKVEYTWKIEEGTK